VEAQWPLRLTLDVGSRVPLHCTASGKLFLAHLPEAQRDTLIERLPLEKMTRNTLVTAEALKAECAQIVQQDCSYDREEFMAGLLAVAVPVRDAEGRCAPPSPCTGRRRVSRWRRRAPRCRRCATRRSGWGRCSRLRSRAVAPEARAGPDARAPGVRGPPIAAMHHRRLDGGACSGGPPARGSAKVRAGGAPRRRARLERGRAGRAPPAARIRHGHSRNATLFRRDRGRPPPARAVRAPRP
jgi:hypothetical protein